MKPKVPDGPANSPGPTTSRELTSADALGRSGSEVVLECELDVTRPFRRIDLTDCPTVRIRNVDPPVAWGIEDRVVEGVDEFGAELNILMFSDGKYLGKAEVYVLLAWAV